MTSGGSAFWISPDCWTSPELQQSHLKEATLHRREDLRLYGANVGWNRFTVQSNDSPPNGPFFGVGIKQFVGDGIHCGAVGRSNASAQTKVLHFTGKLRFESFNVDEWSLTVFHPNGNTPHPAVVKAFCNRLRQIWNSIGRDEIPYSFVLKSHISEEGSFSFSEGDTEAPGFTCATFVLAIFKCGSEELGILDESTWELRPEDAKWQRHICARIESDFGTDGREELQDAVGDIVRFRPSEVAAGTLLDDHPADFSSVQCPAEQIHASVSQAGQ